MYSHFTLFRIVLSICFLILDFIAGYPQSFHEDVSNEIPVISVSYQNDYSEQVNFKFFKIQSSNNFLSDSIKNNISLINYYWWMIISGENSSAIKKNLQYQIEYYKKKFTNNNNDFALIFLLSFDLRVHFYYNELFSAFLCLNELNNILSVSEKTRESLNNEYFILVRNLVNYLNGYIMNKYPFYYRLLIRAPNFDKNISIDNLIRLTSSENNIVNTESNYFLMKIFFDNEHDFTQAEIYAKTLVANYPANFIFSYYFTSILINNNSFNLAQIEKERTLNSIANNYYLSENQKNYCKMLFQNLFDNYDRP